MKQLTIFCSRDEETRVVAALDAAGVEGYLRVGSATGNKFLEPGRVPRTMTWEAAMFVVPALPEERARTVVQTLGDYARNCEIEPCLRMVLAPVDEAC